MSNGALKFRANGQTTSTVVDPRFGLGNNPTMPAGWGSIGGGGTSAPVEGGPGTFVAPSGDTTGATDRAAIQAALDTAGQGSNPHTVYLDGNYHVNGVITMRTGAVLRGSGWYGTVINLAPGSNSDVIDIGGAYRWGLHDLAVDGHSESQTQSGNTTGCGVNVTSTGYNADADGWRGGMVFNMSGIYVHYTKSDGVRLQGGVNEGRMWNCYVIRAGRYGFNMQAGTDFFAGGLTSGESHDHGINWTGDGRLLWCKSWWSGYCPPRGVNPRLSEPTNPKANGYGVGGDGPQFVNCEAQDSAGYGFDIGSSGGYYIIKADQSRNAHLRLMGSNAQIYLDVCPVAHGTTTPALVHTWNGRGNNVLISGWAGRVTAGTGAKAVVWPGASTENDTIRTAQMGAAQKYTTYTPTVSPDYTLGGIKITLAGDIAIGNPVENINGATAEVVLTQDATGGRAVSWGSAYAGISPADTTAGKTSRWSLRCMGTKWVQTAFVSY